MKTVGIIGGLGPETTANFYLQLVENFKKINSKLRPEILIDSVSMDLLVEEDFINGEDKSKEYIDLLVNAAKGLEKSGADFLVIPCNTVHLFIEEVRQSVNIPVLSIIEETIKFLTKYEITKVGLLATKNTISSNLYSFPLEENNILAQIPSDVEQSKIGDLINKLVRNEYSTSDKESLIEVINTLSQKRVETVLLACTDLQLLAPSHPKVTIYDTMKILVEATAVKINS